MSDDSTAEKVWEEWSAIYFPYPNPTHKRAFMAGRASITAGESSDDWNAGWDARDAEVAELRTQLAQRDRAMELRARRYDKLREQLAEANERLRIVEAENDDCTETIMSQRRQIDLARRAAIVGALDALSAPSSTGGNWDCPKCGNDPEDCYCTDSSAGGNDHE